MFVTPGMQTKWQTTDSVYFVSMQEVLVVFVTQ